MLKKIHDKIFHDINNYENNAVMEKKEQYFLCDCMFSTIGSLNKHIQNVYSVDNRNNVHSVKCSYMTTIIKQ